MNALRDVRGSRRLTRLAGLMAGLVVGSAVLVTANPAQAALHCAPDSYESDTSRTAAPLTVGSTVTRAICQKPITSHDHDYFVFTASGSAAYTIKAVGVGSALANDAFNIGGLELSLGRVASDGTMTFDVDQNREPSGDQVITPVLPAGRYVVLAASYETQIYPNNTMNLKTIQGAGGIYGVRLSASAALTVRR